MRDFSSCSGTDILVCKSSKSHQDSQTRMSVPLKPREISTLFFNRSIGTCSLFRIFIFSTTMKQRNTFRQNILSRFCHWGIVCGICIGAGFAAQAQDHESLSMKDLDKLSFDQLLDLDMVQVASRKPLAKKEIPGTVTLIKRDEITRSGARDLIDVLRLVPGFEFGQDINGITGMGTRGLWGFEGKILFLLDGIQMNEIMSGNALIGNNFPIEIIQRIEIIRGPGSSFYGGYAELAVVNIITRKPEDVNGLKIGGFYGQMQQGLGRLNGTLTFGKKFGELGVSASAYIGHANRSDATLLGQDSVPMPMAGNQTQSPMNFNLGLTWKGLRVRAFYDQYTTKTLTSYGSVLSPKALACNFSSSSVDAQYDIPLTANLTLTPRVNYLHQIPWQYNDSSLLNPVTGSPSLYYDKTATRILGSLTLAGDIAPHLFLTAGVEAFADNGMATPLTPRINLFQREFDMGGNIVRASNTVSYTNIGGYVQAFWTNPIVNVNAGMRIDKHSAVPLAAVPWIGLTKVLGNFNAKVLFGQNFRAPTIENIRLNAQIVPEITTAVEVQLGYQLSYNMLLSANLFTVSIANPIVFTTINGNEKYFNYPRTGSNGIELEYSIKDFWGFVNLNYSLAVANNNQVPEYSIAGREDMLLGFAQHKATLNSSFRVFNDNITFCPSATFLSERFGYNGLDASGNATYRRFAPTMLLNAFLQWSNFLRIKRLEIGIGVHDILGTNYMFLQPYNAGNQPLPGPTREFVLRVTYTIPWN
ncbi:MAG: hypothetical protein EAZ92_14750 [Candidatus Kapaibacterium sp.]|nr:MAG: hypothetical protein EAZ92_14750 [Candidatus Kapabacteria bacterium]